MTGLDWRSKSSNRAESQDGMYLYFGCDDGWRQVLQIQKRLSSEGVNPQHSHDGVALAGTAEGLWEAGSNRQDSTSGTRLGSCP